MIRHELGALDGQNPLGFFAALGLLRVLEDGARRRRAEPPRLSWISGASATAVLTSDLSIDAIVKVVLDDAGALGDSRALQLAYTASGEEVPAAHAEAIQDLKPPPALARKVLADAASRSRREAHLAAALFSDLVQDNNGNTKPTAFHFTAGQQRFLAMVEELRAHISAADVLEAIEGPWRNESTLPSLTWDSTAARNYALRAGNPAKEKRGSVPAANWLGVQALEFFPVVAERGRLVTTGVEGGWKGARFAWPLWTPPATLVTLRSLLRLDLRRTPHAERLARGVFRVLESTIERSDQGGYGSFLPAGVVDVSLPSRRAGRWRARSTRGAD